LIWFFRKSRDLWKGKHQALKASFKQLKNKVADLTKSREQWRLKAEQANDQLGALKAKFDNLQAKVEALTSEKKRPSQHPAKVRRNRAADTLWPAVSSGCRATVRVAGARHGGVLTLRGRRLGTVQPAVEP
jgi:predicted  nucleic acid-binding Zn-ribbon protein